MHIGDVVAVIISSSYIFQNMPNMKHEMMYNDINIVKLHSHNTYYQTITKHNI